MKKPEKNLSWSEMGQAMAQDLVKRAKGSKSAIVVFSKSGDSIFQAGMKTAQDFTGLGALISGLHGARSHLDQLLATKTQSFVCGDTKNYYWIHELKDWLVLGVRIPKSAKLEQFLQHLKKQNPRDGKKNVAEALDGLSSAAVDAAFSQGAV